ncbi:MAG: rod shape-determining protein RodA [Pseudomonadota bacterium]
MIIKKIHNLPFALIALITILSGYGVLILYSAAAGSMDPWGYKQLANFLIFMPIAILIALIDLNTIFRYAYIPYCIALLLLIFVHMFGYTAMGAKRWVVIAGLRLQPAELAKIGIVLCLARYFHMMQTSDLHRTSKLLFPIGLLGIPAAFIIKQPDLGTGLLTLIVGMTIFFASGVDLKKMAIAAVTSVISMPILWCFLHDYQKKRILVFLNPELDPLGAGYNIIQSKIAIGSGGVFGKGIGMGTQSHLDFLPEHQTDFIFASLAEEFGFMGVGLLIILYTAVLYIIMSIAINARSIFGKLVVVGIGTIFFSHAFINIAMVAGLLPVVGLPLPFISYGGTMMASMLCGFGLIMNVHVHKHMHIRAQ